MSFTPGIAASYCAYGLRLAGDLAAREKLHLRPPTLTKAAARRLKSGLRALEAYIRRVLFAFALSLEPGLEPNQTWRPRAPRKGQTGAQRQPFRALVPDRPLPDLFLETRGQTWGIEPALSHRRAVQTAPQTAPLLRRLEQLQAILNAPDAYARRLAFHLARRRRGLLAPPGTGRPGLPRRYGRELSALYDGLGPAILKASRARPPPLGPVPKPRPRIRAL